MQEESSLEETTDSEQFYKETEIEDLLDEEAEDDQDEDYQRELDEDDGEEIADYEDQEEDNETMLAKAIDIIQNLISSRALNNQTLVI